MHATKTDHADLSNETLYNYNQSFLEKKKNERMEQRYKSQVEMQRNEPRRNPTYSVPCSPLVSSVILQTVQGLVWCVEEVESETEKICDKNEYI